MYGHRHITRDHVTVMIAVLGASSTVKPPITHGAICDSYRDPHYREHSLRPPKILFPLYDAKTTSDKTTSFLYTKKKTIIKLNIIKYAIILSCSQILCPLYGDSTV